MTKIIQDMIPSKKKPPLREVIPAQKEKRIVRKQEREQEHFEEISPIKNEPKPVRREKAERGIVGKRTVKPWFFGLIALICLLAIVYALSSVYARATVTITPASIVIPFNSTYTAYPANTNASGTLSYQIIQTNSQLNQVIPVTIGPLTTTYAKGAVVLYNNYSSTSQKLVAGTRLLNGNGLVYTINNTVVIPGVVKGIAGSIAVAVTAASAGPSYNIATSGLMVNPSYGDFTIIAYKGTPKYTGFYARLNPNGHGINGGSSGNQIILSSSTVSNADQSMEQSLSKSLLAKAQALVPSGYIMFNNAYTINYTPIAASTTSSTTASIGVSASFSGILFKLTDLAHTISPTQYNNMFNVEDLQSAVFTIINPQIFSTTNNAPLNFSLTGTMNLVGTFSTTTLASQLINISQADSATVFKKYSTIASVHATIVPFWRHSFPSSPSRISIVIAQ